MMGQCGTSPRKEPSFMEISPDKSRVHKEAPVSLHIEIAQRNQADMRGSQMTKEEMDMLNKLNKDVPHDSIFTTKSYLGPNNEKGFVHNLTS